MRSSRAHFLALGTAVALLCGPAAIAQTSGEPTDLPVLSDETPRGEGIAELAAAITPVAKTVDGLIGDWVGVSSRYGGTAVYSGGEYVYQDHLFEARGADDGRDAAKLERLEMLKDVPGIYRVDALSQANAPGEFGVPIPEDFSYDDTYGDAASHQDHADLAEVRVAVQGDYLHVLARTTTMKADSPPTGLLLLADTKTGTTTLPVPFNSGISTTRGDVAVFMSGTMRSTVDLATNAPGPLTTDDVATNADGFTNAIEARVPLGLVTGADGNLHLAIASGTANETGTAFTDLDLETNDAVVTANLANVAFRDEPVRVWFEKEQALSLFAGTIDPFFRTVEPIALGTANETYVPGPGYHDRIFISESTPSVLSEGGENGSFQHYGLYLPSAIANSTADLALQWWLHWRGGSAHVAGGFIPKMFKQYGEDRNAIVVSPSGRGSSLWYVGKGHVDFLEVWANLFEAYGGRIDRNRVYVSGARWGVLALSS